MGDSTSDGDFVRQIEGYGLSTVQIHYYMPDHPSLLQLFVMQQYDLAPTFPELDRFLAYWRAEIEAVLHSVRVAHKHLIGPAEWRAVDGVISLH
ncbi:MAG TPA: usg protein [Croceibacterium sp.]|nr:usg protein [Croceibacterium sp.]